MDLNNTDSSTDTIINSETETKNVEQKYDNLEYFKQQKLYKPTTEICMIADSESDSGTQLGNSTSNSHSKSTSKSLFVKILSASRKEKEDFKNKVLAEIDHEITLHESTIELDKHPGHSGIHHHNNETLDTNKLEETNSLSSQQSLTDMEDFSTQSNFSSSVSAFDNNAPGGIETDTSIRDALAMNEEHERLKIENKLPELPVITVAAPNPNYESLRAMSSIAAKKPPLHNSNRSYGQTISTPNVIKNSGISTGKILPSPNSQSKIALIKSVPKMEDRSKTSKDNSQLTSSCGFTVIKNVNGMKKLPESTALCTKTSDLTFNRKSLNQINSNSAVTVKQASHDFDNLQIKHHELLQDFKELELKFKDEQQRHYLTTVCLRNSERGRIAAENRNQELQSEMTTFLDTFGDIFTNQKIKQERVNSNYTSSTLTFSGNHRNQMSNLNHHHQHNLDNASCSTPIPTSHPIRPKQYISKPKITNSIISTIPNESSANNSIATGPIVPTSIKKNFSTIISNPNQGPDNRNLKHFTGHQDPTLKNDTNLQIQKLIQNKNKFKHKKRENHVYKIEHLHDKTNPTVDIERLLAEASPPDSSPPKIYKKTSSSKPLD